MSKSAPLRPFSQPWIQRFHDLMPNRVRDVLLVSSGYDAFVLEEDGSLVDRLFVEYSELNLSYTPRLTHVSSPGDALKILKERHFDLVVTTTRMEEIGVRSLSRRVKAVFPHLPVVVLALDEFELRRLPAGPVPRTIDGVFLWTGDARILLAIIKLVEDYLNVEHDTSRTGVQVIIVVEDQVHRYSTFLALLYTELMIQSQSLIAEGVNALHKLMRMRARPKVLLACNYEEALRLYTTYQDHVLALISDIAFPRGGELDAQAGFTLAQRVLQDRPGLPILFLSAEPENEERARDLGRQLLDKNSPRLLRGIRDFLQDNLGFGDFIFRLPDHTEVARACDAYELEKVLHTVDARSLLYHASNNHFHVWLRARSMFELADRLASIQASEFATVEDLREFLIQTLQQLAQREQAGVIAEFGTHEEAQFARIGGGSLGGKGRGIAFMNAWISRHGLGDIVKGLRIDIPRTLVLATSVYDAFLEANGLADLSSEMSDADILTRFQAAPPHRAVEEQLTLALERMAGPLAVRSSSLLEDSQHQSCAGVYTTLMLPNTGTPAQRREQLWRAVAQVYASTMSSRARAYLASSPFSVQDEKMAVVIQEVVGRGYASGRFYPHGSGVALSLNYYPVGPQQSEEGVAMLALGLGHTVMEGRRTVRFCPSHPQVLPYLEAPREWTARSQSQFYAVDVRAESPEQALRLYDLQAAELDGSLGLVASVYSPDDERLRDGLSTAGPRVVTFSNILRWKAVPLAEALHQILEVLRQGMGTPIEIEFALDLGDWPETRAEPPTLYLLQIRPVAEPGPAVAVALDQIRPEQTICASDHVLGHGTSGEVRDLLVVDPRGLDRRQTGELARLVAAANARMQRPYLLVGPGRWGSSDPALGIPVDFMDIGGARVLVEVPFADLSVEPSQGSHFFHELVARRIGYMWVAGGGAGGHFDWEWLDQQSSCLVERHGALSHYRLDQPVWTCLDGLTRRGVITRPGVEPEPG